MTTYTSENKKITTESEIGSNGVGHSKVQGSEGEATQPASPKELALALEMSQKTIQVMEKEIEALKSAKTEATAPSTDSKLDKLIEAISSAVAGAKTGPTTPDNLNTTKDYSQRQIIDGNSLMEAQATLQMYKNEKKVPISIPKSFMSSFGPSLPISVNGVRVSIPCDGRTYYINETHAEAAKERIAKVDRLLADQEPNISEVTA